MKKVLLLITTTIMLSTTYVSNACCFTKRHRKKNVAVRIMLVGNDEFLEGTVFVGITHDRLLECITNTYITPSRLRAWTWLRNKNLQLVHKKFSIPSGEFLSAETVKRFPAGKPIELVLLILNDTQEREHIQESYV